MTKKDFFSFIAIIMMCLFAGCSQVEEINVIKTYQATELENIQDCFDATSDFFFIYQLLSTSHFRKNRVFSSNNFMSLLALRFCSQKLVCFSLYFLMSFTLRFSLAEALSAIPIEEISIPHYYINYKKGIIYTGI